MAGHLPATLNPDSQTLNNVFQFLKHKNLKETEEALKRELGISLGGQSSLTPSATVNQPDQVDESYAKVRPDSTSELTFCEEEGIHDINEEEDVSNPGTPHNNATYFVYPKVIDASQLAPLRAPPPLLSSPPPPLLFKSQISPTPLPLPTLYTVIPPGLIGGATSTSLINPFINHSPIQTTPTSVMTVKPSSTTITTSCLSQSPTLTQKNAATLASIPVDEMTPAHHELKRFAEEFKAKRIQLGYTQGAVGQSLAEKGYSNFAQSTISRFEQMQLSPSNASAIMVVLKRWLYEAENPDAVSSTSDPLGPPRKRKKRVVYTPQSLKVLNKWFEDEPRPNRQIIEAVAQELDLQPEEVRVWFCNKRQKQKMTNDPTTSEDDYEISSPVSATNRCTPSPPQTKFTIEELSKSSSTTTTTTNNSMVVSPLSFNSQLTVSPTIRPMIFATTNRHTVNLPFNFMSTKA